MGIDYVQSRECKVKQDLGVDELVARIKARGQAALLVKRLERDGQDPAEASITRIVQYPSGPVSEQITVAELLATGRTLDPYKPHCVECTANFRQTAFGCCGFLNYPIAAAEEEWLLARLPARIDSTAGAYLRNVIDQLGLDGAALADMRKQGRLFFENAVAPARQWDLDGATLEISTNPILQFMFYGGPVGPPHAALLCLFLGLLPHDIAPETMQSILSRPETLQDHLAIDPAALSMLQGTQMGMFLMGMMSAAINREILTISA